MKLFVAAEAQPEDDDWCEAIPGELVRFPVEPCDCPGCGAERSMYGLASQRSTSVVMVRELELDEDTFESILWDSLQAGGWVDRHDPADRAWAQQFARDHVEAASHLPTEQPFGILHSQLED